MSSELVASVTAIPYPNQAAPNGFIIGAERKAIVPTALGVATVFAPPSASEGSTFAVVDGDGLAAVSNITVDGNGHTIDGAASVVLNTANAEAIFVFDSGNWKRLVPYRRFTIAGSTVPFIMASDLSGLGGGGGGGGVVIFDGGLPSENARTTRATQQSPIDNTKQGIVNLSSKSGGVALGAIGSFSTIPGGDQCSATDAYCSVSGGFNNAALGQGSTVGGGENNLAGPLADATVAGGVANTASSTTSTVGGGTTNVASDIGATVCGGSLNQATANHANVAGGFNNQAINTRAAVGGGAGNVASGDLSTVAGGSSNTAASTNGTVGGGVTNIIAAASTRGTICGGALNTISATSLRGTIGGGQGHTVGGNSGTISGGLNCTIDPSVADCSIGGGNFNRVRAGSCTIAGGFNNDTNSGAGTIGGGDSNLSTGGGVGATISGGQGNATSGVVGYQTICGGQENQVVDARSTVLGGKRARASRSGSVVHADGNFTTAGDAQHDVGKVMRVAVAGGAAASAVGEDGAGLILETGKAYVIKATTVAAIVGIAGRAGFKHTILCHVTAGVCVVDAVVADAANVAMLNGQLWTLVFAAAGIGLINTFTAVGTAGAQTVRVVLNYEIVQVGGVT